MKPDQAWLRNLDLRGRLLVHLACAQSRTESAMVSRFRSRWHEDAIRRELRAMHDRKLVSLLEADNVRWSLTVAGRNAFRAAAERAKRKAAA